MKHNTTQRFGPMHYYRRKAMNKLLDVPLCGAPPGRVRASCAREQSC